MIPSCTTAIAGCCIGIIRVTRAITRVSAIKEMHKKSASMKSALECRNEHDFMILESSTL